MVFFEDFGKTVRDLLKKGDYEGHGMTLTCTTANSKLSTECLLPGGSKFSVADERYGNIKLEARDELEKRFEYNSPTLMERFNVKFGISKFEGALSTDYAEGQLAAKCKVELLTKSGEKFALTGEVAKEMQGLWIGGELKCTSVNGLEEAKVGMHYEKDGTELSFRTDFDELNVQLWKKYSSRGSMAANYDLNLNCEGALVSVGGILNLDEHCLIRGFLQSDGNTYLLYKQKLSDQLSASVGTSFVLNKIMSNVNVSYRLEFEA